MSRGSGEIVIGGRRFNIGVKVVNFMDDAYFNAHAEQCLRPSRPCPQGIFPFAQYKSPKQRADPDAPVVMRKSRFRPRRIGERTFGGAQAVIRQFVVHLDGCADAEMCFNVLHNERGLSCHFIIDNDGTIVQTLDLVDCAFHAAGLNETSIGVELCNRGDAKKYPRYYDHRTIKRDLVTCTIHNHRYLAYGFTEMQYQAMGALGLALAKLLPGIRLEFPQETTGLPRFTTIPDFKRFTGYLGHYNIESQKWDPGPFDWKKFMRLVRGRRSFPLGLASLDGKLELPSDPADLERVTGAYYENNEQGGGGFFPVGPLERFRLWHGGAHLHGNEGDRVVAPLPGAVVAARQGDPYDSIGSTSFVLARHEIKIGETPLAFYTLYFHLAKEEGSKASDVPKWLAAEGYGDPEPGTVVVLDPPETLQAGDLVGHVGSAGPEDARAPQLHFEVFAVDPPPGKLNEDGFWKIVDGSADLRFATHKDVVPLIDKNKKDGISRQELFDFFRGGSDESLAMRRVVAYHVSEWTEKPDWKAELASAAELKLSKADIEKIYVEQIEPAIWWTDSLAERLKLPKDGRVYTYHPVTFLAWLQQKLEASAKGEVGGVTLATADDIKNAKAGTAKDDNEDVEGTSMIEESDLEGVVEEKVLELEDLVDGYGEE